MPLLKDFLMIDAERRAAQQALRQDAMLRRLRIDELSQEAKQKRDEISILEQELSRLSSDLIRLEQEILDLDLRREEYEHEAVSRKAESLILSLKTESESSVRFADEFKRLRSSYYATRDRLLAMSETGRMMDNYYQLEKFLSDAAHPIPEAARAALQKERTDLMAKIGPLVTTPPSPEGILRLTIVYSAFEGRGSRALAAFGLPTPSLTPASNDVLALLVFGAYAAAVERLGNQAPAPIPAVGGTLFSFLPVSTSPAEAAFELCIALDEGLKKTASALTIRLETASLFIEPEIAEAVFSNP